MLDENLKQELIEEQQLKLIYNEGWDGFISGLKSYDNPYRGSNYKEVSNITWDKGYREACDKINGIVLKCEDLKKQLHDVLQDIAESNEVYNPYGLLSKEVSNKRSQLLIDIHTKLCGASYKGLMFLT